MIDKELTYQQKCFIWASGHYLSEELDPDFFDLETEDQLLFPPYQSQPLVSRS